MAYLTGSRLELAIKENNLEDLYLLLEGYSKQGVWPRDQVVRPDSPDDINPYRNIIYSILNHLMLKHDFSVRLTGVSLIVGLKGGRKKTTVMGVDDSAHFQPSQPGQPGSSGQREEVLGDEGFREMFEETEELVGGKDEG